MSFNETAGQVSAITTSGEGAMKYSTTDNPFLTQFASVGSYMEKREFLDISRDCIELWTIDKLQALKFIFYLRIVSRRVLRDGTKQTKEVQKGPGLKHEAQMRMYWLAINSPDNFYNNLELFLSVGSWKDFFEIWAWDIQNGHKVLNEQKMLTTFSNGILFYSTNMVRKYMPSLVSNSKCKTPRAKARRKIVSLIMKYHDMHPQTYRSLKSSGTSHTWQQIISQKRLQELDFSKIHGRALNKLINSKLVEHHGLESAIDKWLDTQANAKFTGYVHELGVKLTPTAKPYVRKLADLQYLTLKEAAKTGAQQTLVIRDVSGSMVSSIIGKKSLSSNTVAKGLSIMFSDLATGHFHNQWWSFAHGVNVRKYPDGSFSDKWLSDTDLGGGSTNVLGVAELLVKIFATVDILEFPTTLLFISDGEFTGVENKTTVERFRDILLDGGLPGEYVDETLRFVFWDIRNSFYSSTLAPSFETYTGHNNVFYIGGYDPSVLGFLFNNSRLDKPSAIPKTAEELLSAALAQEILEELMVC